jgi:beta-lactamase class A
VQGNPADNTIKHKLGQTCQGDDGKTYVYAKANGTIASAVAVCTVSPTTFLATNAGGAYTAPTVTGGMVIGDYAWFSKAGV